MKSNLLKLLLAASAFAFSVTVTNAQTAGIQYVLGWSTFDTVGDNNTKLNDTTPNLDTSGGFLSGAIGTNASGNGYGGQGKNTAVISGMNDGTFGSEIAFTGSGNSVMKAITDSGRHRIDFKITNESTTNAFRLQKIHFDARVANANANDTYLIEYLSNNGNSNLFNVSTQSNVSNLADIATDTLSVGTSEHDISIASNLTGSGPVRLAAGDSASFRITWTGSAANFAQTQMDNLAFSGEFIANAVPEPSSYALLAGLFACSYMMVRRRARG
jgi:hypothetical protein